GDQPKAIKTLTENLKNGAKHQVLLGVTGSGKTFTMANVIEKIQKPTLIISPNKTLAAQLYQEFKEFFPNNAVHYFVSYYDYYQPEAYIPQTDTYIEKDAKINEEIDRMRHSAVQDLISRDDVIVVASVSCIYNIGSPKNYKGISFEIKQNQKIKRSEFILKLSDLQYQRNDILARNASRSDASGEFKPGVFRVRGDMIEIFIVTGDTILRVEFENDKISRMSVIPAKAGIQSISTDSRFPIKSGMTSMKKYTIFPAHFWLAPHDKIKLAIKNIQDELTARLKELKKQKKLLEAERLEQRTNYDIEMLQETGFCYGIENYSSHLEFRPQGQAPFSLVDYFKQKDNGSLIFIDESHISISQIRAMSIGDKIRKETLINFGFRLPSAVDNRPLKFNEFEERVKQAIYVSATPAIYETEKSGKNIIEQIIRPTGLLEPKIKIRKTENQIQDLIKEIQKRISLKSARLNAPAFGGERVLVITLTKRLAEEIADYLLERGIKAQYLHSEVKTLERPEILKKFRQGEFDVLIGINLLREGLDLPEVSLVAILDADKEGFLRNKTTLIQTMGRAARHINGQIILYADKTTMSMQGAIDEINRRRKIQENYNKKNNITPTAIIKNIRDWDMSKKEDITLEFPMLNDKSFDKLRTKRLLEKEMKQAVKNLDFERAAELRDLINKLTQI
ncbi:MAG: excinuclease ABC subunit B, partial [Candidatus Staskawiczbacteria bacterium RIFOXYA2_FULL_32_7]